MTADPFVIEFFVMVACAVVQCFFPGPWTMWILVALVVWAASMIYREMYC